MPRLRQTLRMTIASAALLLLCGVSASAADLGIGSVTASSLRLRAEANTTSSILATATEGDYAIVKEDAGNGWYKVDYKSITGYMSADYVNLSTTLEADLGYGRVEAEGSTLNVRTGPGTDYDRVEVLYDGAVVKLLGMDNGWYKLDHNGSIGYASSDYIVLCQDDSGRRSDETVAVSSLGQEIVAYAKQYLGTPYVWAANGPNSFDCSGFTKYIYAHFGYSINRTASGQLQNGVSVSRSELQPGDLVFFHNGKSSSAATHVGIYIGNNEFIHASTNTYNVTINSLIGTTYDRKYVYARRLI